MKNSKSIKKILIPRFDTLGDIILIEGLIESLLNFYPEVDITMLVRDGYEQLAPLFPDALKWITTSLNPYIEFDKNNVREIDRLIDDVSKTDWNLILFTTYSKTWLDLVLAARVKNSIKVAFSQEKKRNLHHERILKNIGLNYENIIDKEIEVDEKLHEVHKYEAMWSELADDKSILLPPKIKIPIYFDNIAEKILSSFGMKNNKYFVCMPAGLNNVSIKKWPEEHFVEVISWVCKEYGFIPLLVGHESEKAIIDQLIELCKNKGVETYRWIGKDGEIPVLAALTSRSLFYVGNDSGPMHIAAAIGIPTVGIFGGGTFTRFIPYSDKSIGIVSDMPCFGCGWDCIFGDAPCVKLVTVNDVKNAIQKVLNNTSSPPRIVHASREISEETAKFIEKAKKRFDVLNNDRAARLEVIERMSAQLLKQEALLQGNEALHKQLSAQQEALQKQLSAQLLEQEVLLQRNDTLQKQLVEKNDLINSLWMQKNYLESFDGSLRVVIKKILMKAGLFNVAIRYKAPLSSLYQSFRGRRVYPPVAKTPDAVKPASGINSPVVEALVVARSIVGDMNERSLIDFYELGSGFHNVLCVQPDASMIQALYMLSKAGSKVTCLDWQHSLGDLLSYGFTIYHGNLAEWMSHEGCATMIGYDCIILDQLKDADDLNVLKGRLGPDTKIIAEAHTLTQLGKGLAAASSGTTVGTLEIYDRLPETWLDSMPKEIISYQKNDWPLHGLHIKSLEKLPSGRLWPKISIVTVTYNQGSFLEETIRSVLLQGYPNLEYIVIDGDSTDNTPVILDRYRKELAYCISEKDKGQSDALNKGFRLASGDILAWLNSDDRYMPWTLWRVALAFDSYAADMVAGGCALVHGDDKTAFRTHHNAMPMGKVVSLPLDQLLDIDGSWQKGNFFYQPEVFWSRSLWERSGAQVDESLFYSMDYELWLRMARSNARIVHIPDTLALFRFHEKQKTSGDLPFLSELRRVSANFKSKNK